jgi:dihydrofolate reductase
MSVTLIAAVDLEWGIAKNGSIPWLCKEDLRFFAKTTKGELNRNRKNAVIMGKTTYLTLPRPLIDRVNYVVSTSLFAKNPCSPELKWYRYLSSAVNDAKLSQRDVFIIGGESIYKQCLEANFVDRLLISVIPSKYECDQFLDIKSYGFKLTNEQNMGNFSVCTYE